jgi:hypothetical protein
MSREPWRLATPGRQAETRDVSRGLTPTPTSAHRPLRARRNSARRGRAPPNTAVPTGRLLRGDETTREKRRFGYAAHRRVVSANEWLAVQPLECPDTGRLARAASQYWGKPGRIGPQESLAWRLAILCCSMYGSGGCPDSIAPIRPLAAFGDRLAKQLAQSKSP